MRVLTFASNSREDSPKVKWEGIRCQLEDAQSDILLLLDTCAVADGPAAGSHGIKQCIAAYSPEQMTRDAGMQSFTHHLVQALYKLGTGRPFNVQRLHEEILALKHNAFLQHNIVTNEHTKAASTHERLPICFNLTSGSLQSIALCPLLPGAQGSVELDSFLEPLDSLHGSKSFDEKPSDSHVSAELTFEEKRALVCTTFLGEPSQDMASFKQWLQNTPVAAAKITVEGMFHGPPTILLVSMPIAVWNVVAADRTCCFLGYVNSHNMTTEYQHLVNAISPNSKSTANRELEHGKILLEAREAAASTPNMVRGDSFPHDGLSLPGSATQAPLRRDSMTMSTSSLGPQVVYPGKVGAGGPATGEESVEMHEAAEQLKLLSHVRHLNQSNRASSEHAHALLTDEMSGHAADGTADISMDDSMYHQEYSIPPPTRPAKARRPGGNKGSTKQETHCNLCTHAPFKDSSSLKKHVAAAHTRPFPCAFAFAGCPSTFGSKNEWKRHIASQHLCLTFYRCSACSHAGADGKGNEFNRKDLFTQHLRRMHAPFAIKKALSKGDGKLQSEWEDHVKEMHSSCLMTRRLPPQRSECPKLDCVHAFEGPGSWDEWMEHVGRHMEKGDAGNFGIDLLLAGWALEEGIIEENGEGGYRICGAEGSSSSTHGAGHGAGHAAGHDATHLHAPVMTGDVGVGVVGTFYDNGDMAHVEMATRNGGAPGMEGGGEAEALMA